MRRNVLILVLLLVNIILLKAQLGIDNLGFQNKNLIPVPVTADTYSLSKVGKLPMDLFRGKANINILIYNISVDGINIPISLSYNTGGIKLNEVSSIVGLGWSLNIPGFINKTIYGKDDSDVPFFSKDIITYGSYDGYVSHTASDDERRNNLWHIFNGLYDLKPDLFNYNIPNVSGTFILKENIGLTIPYEDVKIDYIHSPSIYGKQFKVSDSQGNIYWFSTKNLSDFSDPTSALSLNVNSVTYKLDSIKTAANKEVKFFYNKNIGYTERNSIEKVYTSIGENHASVDNCLNLPPKYEKWESQTNNSENLITRIEFPLGSVEFKYSDDNEELIIENELYRKDLNSVNGVALRQIVVKDLSNHIVSENKLNYGYFKSSGSQYDYENYRLKLLNVQNVLSNTYHKFTYNEEILFPPRNSNNDDYWGYINSISNSSMSSNIPSSLKYPISLPINLNTRDRSANPDLIQAGILISIEYPTKGIKNLYYESPQNESIKDLMLLIPYNGMHKDVSSFYDPEVIFSDVGAISDSYIYEYSDFPQQSLDHNVHYSFNNSCTNAENTGPGNEVPPWTEEAPTMCIGTIIFVDPITDEVRPSMPRTSGGWLFEGTYTGEFPVKIKATVNKIGKCNCSITTAINWKEYVKSTETTRTYLPGLRINKVEDVNEDNITNIFNYKYGKYHTSDKFEEIGVLKKPFNFTKIDKKVCRRLDNDNLESFPQGIDEFFTLMNSSQSSNTYGSADAVTYPFVIEENELGKVYYEFTDKDYQNQSAISPTFENYNDWKNGLLLSTKYINKLGDTVRITKNEYKINPLKNGLSDFNTLLADKLAFAVDINIIPLKIKLGPSIEMEGEAFHVNNEISFIESGKIENTMTTTKEFFQNDVLETKTFSSYYDDDINKPMNLKKLTTTFPDQSVSEITYQYAHEKGNQRLIDANMIGIPLETEKRLNNNAISKSETKYDSSSNLFPSSVLSYDLQNSPNTEVTYDQYDSKGNLLQYTSKDGTSTSIVWGYNQTQPIAKIEGAIYGEVKEMASIVDASDLDSNNDDEALLSTLDVFRNQNSNYLITTYTYRPLVGVSSITPPTGIREYYYYDDANRLQFIKDVNGKILKEYKYNYKQ